MASSSKEEEEKKDIMDIVAERIASLKQTLNAIDQLEDRWQTVQKEFGMKLSFAFKTLGAAMPTELNSEQKEAVLGGKPTLGEICARMKDGHFRKIIVMTGAGISVSAGIPDFRSPVSGLYDSIDISKYNLDSPQAVFEINQFHKDPRPFFSVVKQLLPGKFQPTPSHYFIKILADKALLHRCYTQNIDGLERLAGITEQYLVEAHGTLAKSKCIECGRTQETEEVHDVIMKNDIPKCSTCKNILKPSIVFFGEELPSRFKLLNADDFAACDLLIVMGTSLKVLPFSSLINSVKDTTPRLLLNRERVGSFTLEAEGGYRDVAVLQDCDRSVREICEECGWKNDLDALLFGNSKSTAHAANPKKAVSMKKQDVKVIHTASPKQPVSTEKHIVSHTASPKQPVSTKKHDVKASLAASPKQPVTTRKPDTKASTRSGVKSKSSLHTSSKLTSRQKHGDHHH